MVTPRQLGWGVAAAAAALLVGPVLVDVLFGGPVRLFGAVAADAFYYLVVGRNLGLHGSLSYDGVHLSNGFHPAWQALVALPYAVRLLGEPSLADLRTVVALGLVCTTAAVLLLARALVREDGSLHPVFVLLPVGAYALLVSPAWLSLTLEKLKEQNSMEGSEPLYGTLWSFVNGMETPLVLLAFASCLWVWTRPGVAARSATYGGLLALLTLARLDHLAVAGPLAVLAAWNLRREPRALARMAAALVIPVGLYLASNRVFFGGWVPVSGALKSTAPTMNGEAFGHLVAVFNSVLGPDRPPIFVYWRVLQLAVPALAALVSPLFLLAARRTEQGLVVQFVHPRAGPFLAATALGVLAITGYDFLFTQFMSHGHWYVPVPVLFVSLLVFSRVNAWQARLGPRATLALVVLALALGGKFFHRLHRHEDYHRHYYDFFAQVAPEARAALGRNPPRLLEFDDGIVSWATGFPAMSATGFGLDPEGARALQRGELLSLAVARGYDHLTSLVYFGSWGLPPNPNEEQMAAWGRGMHRVGDLSAWRLSMAWRSPTTAFLIVRLQK